MNSAEKVRGLYSQQKCLLCFGMIGGLACDVEEEGAKIEGEEENECEYFLICGKLQKTSASEQLSFIGGILSYARQLMPALKKFSLHDKS